MNRIICPLIFFNFLLLNSFGQQAFNCSSHEFYSKQLRDNPAFKKNQEQLEHETQLQLSHGANRSAAAPAFIIPVVFHVIHTGGTGNISSAQIIDQVNILNKEFNRQQADTILTPSAFLPAAAPFSVEFRLATLDPSGNCTNGINRVQSSLSICSFDQEDVKALSNWPSNKYLNIWLVQTMHYSSSMNCVGGGYASFPGGPALLDGINIRSDLISNVGTAATNSGWGNFKGRYLIHELGHWFNLRHIWGDATCGNDFVSDTPPALASNGGCPSFPHNPSSSCSGSGPNGEMFTNYMDYTNGPCLNMFTAGQVARMTACMNSNVSGRSNLWSNANLNATGTNNPYTYPASCASQPDLLPYGAIIACEGDSVKFTDNSYGGQSTSRLWDFAGNAATSLSDSIVKVHYTTAGIYSVSLTNNYLSASKTASFTNKVFVLSSNPNPNYSIPYSDDLEDPFNFDLDWTRVDKDNDGVGWELVTSTAYSGLNSAGIMNFGKPGPLTDELISPAYDLSNIQNPTMNFQLHFTGRVSANYDRLQVYVSNNCGKTWNMIYNKSATSGLATVPNLMTSSYIPGFATTEWRLENFIVPSLWATGTARFKFTFISGGGNNIFIDDINISGMNITGITKNQQENRVSLFPNPSSGSVAIGFMAEQSSAIRIEVVDVLGKSWIMHTPAQITSGENTTELNTTTLGEGVYFVRIVRNGVLSNTLKFIKQSQD